MLAGEAGRVMYGENARKEQLLAGVQQRSQQDYLQGQRQQHQESMQNKRIFSTLQNAQTKLLQDNNQFKKELDYKKGRDEAEMGLSMKRLGELKRQNDYSQGKAERDRVSKEFKFFDENLDRLNSQYNIISRKPDKTPEEKQVMSELKTEMDRVQYTKDQYWQQVVDPEFQNVIRDGRAKFDSIRQQRLDKLFKLYRPVPGGNFGNTSYPAPQGTDADKSRYNESDPFNIGLN